MILKLLQFICELLDNTNIAYMISGSIASNVYTIPRMTRDIDIVIELPLSKIDEFVSKFSNFYFDKLTIKEEIKREGMFNIIDNSTGFKIDFIIRKNSEYYNLAFNRRKRVKEFGTELWVISVEDLIIAKLIWTQQIYSEQQIRDIQNLLLFSEIDFDYIIEWCKKLKLKTFNLFFNE